MSILKLAIDARVPFIAVKSDDLLYVEEVLKYIAEEPVSPFFPSEIPENLDNLALPAADVLYTSACLESKELYHLIAKKNKTVVFVNTKPSAFHFPAGVLLPPKLLVYETLKNTLKDDSKVAPVMTAVGGLTLKDVREVLQLTMHKYDGEVTADNINAVRKQYVQKLKGMVQVDTDFDFYDCPVDLSSWIDQNLFFFVNDVHPSLRPSGLLFDGPPGTGKTAASKLIAKMLGMPLYRLDVGGMKGKYVGDSESNLQAALQSADQLSPCVVILDEIEKMFGETHDSGVTSSMLGNLLWWLQERESKVFVVMTTNNVKRIPRELYREGRIDKVLTFAGLENSETAIDFAKKAASSLCKAVTEVDEDAVIEEVILDLQTQKLPIPQIKVITMVQSAVKAKYLEKVE